jgi:hypothetical protein
MKFPLVTRMTVASFEWARTGCETVGTAGAWTVDVCMMLVASDECLLVEALDWSMHHPPDWVI